MPSNIAEHTSAFAFLERIIQSCFADVDAASNNRYSMLRAECVTSFRATT
jgi:hypothetical protein